MKRIKSLFILLLASALAMAAWLAWYANQTLDMGVLPKTFSITPGTSLHALTVQLEREHIVNAPLSFRLLGRAIGKSAHLKAGVYEVTQALTPLALYDKIERGDVAQAAVQFIEGWNIREVRAALRQQDALTHASETMSDMELLAAIGASEGHIEGLLFPDTYFFAPHSVDLEIVRRAYRLQSDKLRAEWADRASGLPYQTPYEALIMASIIEKETGAESERPQIAAVFINRLKKDMRLQTDPTVIYGLGEHFDGNLRKVDLQRDTPYNTYTRSGLPPTPIAIPGAAAIHAALHPVHSDALYFVARGNGTHVFSSTLDAHNRAVNQYQR
ncbi:MAG: endolytic transglycosylase MltG [Thiobacillaceae bacterium]